MSSEPQLGERTTICGPMEELWDRGGRPPCVVARDTLKPEHGTSLYE